MSRWRVPDRRYRSGWRWTPQGRRARAKWFWLTVLLLVLIAVTNRIPFVLLGLVVVFFAYAIQRNQHWRSIDGPPRGPIPTAGVGPIPAPAAAPLLPPDGYRFNPAPGWPPAPVGWVPAPGWQPDPSWPPQPVGWPLWVPDRPDDPPEPDAPVGERRKRAAIRQDVKIAVAVRDEGKCRCAVGVSCHGYPGRCGSTTELHYDHVIPWVNGGTDTVANLQLLCGPCNRRKGADDIPWS